jgi:phosphotransferase family enzyme
MTCPLLRPAIAALLDDPQDRILARSIFGTADADAIVAGVTHFVARQLDRAIIGCPLFIQSVGAVFGLDLDDGTRVAMKVHAFGDHQRGFTSHDQLAAVYAAQTDLAAAGLPCPRVLCPPAALGSGVAAITTWLCPASRDDPHAPTTRRALAAFLARTVELGAALPTRHRLVRSTLPPDAVFPPPHNALFDFSAPGGAWIDPHARRARHLLDHPTPLVVMHTDVSCANVIVSGGAVAAAYDMDSIAWIDELRCLGSVAVHFTYTGEPSSRWPARDQALAFVADYEAARGRAFTAHEQARIEAAMTYAIAYTARCEGGTGTMSSQLAACPDTGG